MLAKLGIKPVSKKAGCLSIVALLFLCSLPAAFMQEKNNAVPRAASSLTDSVPVEESTTAPVEIVVNPLVDLPTNTPTVMPPIVPVVLPTTAPVIQPVILPTEPPAGATVNSGANLRSGPGIDYVVINTAAAGTVLTLIGRNQAGNWYQTDGGVWISADLVDNAPAALAVVNAPPPPPPVVVAPTAEAPVVNTPPIAIPSASCTCETDSLNCGDFSSQSTAQACFDYCMATVGRDIHRLDRDNNRLVCESSW